MRHTETVRLACISVGIDPDLAHQAAIAHARMAAAPAAMPSLTDRVQAMVERISAAFDFTSPPSRRMTATEVCRHIGIGEPTRAEQADAGRALVIVTRRRPMKTNGKQVYVMPSK